MPETVFPISDSVIAVLQSAAVLPARSADAFSPSVMAAVTCVELQYSLEHSMLMRCVNSLRNAWLAMGGTLHSSYQLPSAADHTQAVAYAYSDSPSESPDLVGGSVSHSQRVRQLESQICSLKAHIQDLEAQLAATASSLSQSSLNVAADQSLNAESIITASGGRDADTTVFKCSAAVLRGIRRSDPKFLRETFDRHTDGTGSLYASNLTAALTEADAPVIPDCDAAAAAAIARFDSNSNGVMELGEFERAVSMPDELQLYFQEKQQPALADALRVLVGRGSDQLLRVSRLSPSDMRAASAAVCASVAEQAAWLHEELQRLFTAQVEIQTQMEADAGKFNVVKMACGGVEDFHSGLTGRVGMPHLKFKDAMQQEHCERAGCNTQFTTGNYKITTTPRQEWLYIAGDEAGQQMACADVGHGRRIVRISELMKLKLAIDAQLTEVEMLAIVLYTGPMFQVYNCILRRFPADKYAVFEQGGNRYATTIFVLVSAVQKVSRCTRMPEGTLLYRGLGGLIDLPDKFHQADAQGRSGFLDWGMMSTSSERDVALGYSGVKLRRPKAMVMVIEVTAVDRGADISEFSQYPGEKEFLWLPCSFVQRALAGGGRVQVVDGGLVTFVPVRVNLNLKTETVEELLQKKKSMHVTGFEFRVNELRQQLRDEASAGNAEARLKRENDLYGEYWEKEHSVEGFIEAQTGKVSAVLELQRARAAADYSDDGVYRSLVAESLDAASMAQSALRWWLRDAQQVIHGIEHYSLLEFQRRFESFLRLRYASAEVEDERRSAAVELCKASRLMRSDAKEKDGNLEPPLVALSARGGSGEDVALLVAAGADVAAVADKERCCLYLAAQQGHVEMIGSLIRAGANCNQADWDGTTPLWIGSLNGHMGSVKALLEAGADETMARTEDGMTPLYMACQNGHTSVVELLLGRVTDVNKATTDDGMTPLYIACQEGHASVVELLLGRGADVNKATTDDCTTPLNIACNNGHSRIVELLLGRDPDMNKARTDDGTTPLYIACEEGYTGIVELLLGRGADVNKARKDDGTTPLIVACQNGHTRIVSLLGGDRLVAAAAAEHAGAVQLHRAAGNVVVTRHRGGGCVTSDYLLQFFGFNTFVADVRLCGGCFYLELQVVEIVGEPLFGFCTREFEPRKYSEGEGAGDDAWSWAVDGVRQMKWHEGDGVAYGCKWSVGDVIGLALDMRTAGNAAMSVSVNGSFAAPNGPAFTDMQAAYLSPAFSGDGRYRVNFGERPFVHAPPDAGYMSVHAFHLEHDDDDDDDGGDDDDDDDDDDDEGGDDGGDDDDDDEDDDDEQQ